MNFPAWAGVDAEFDGGLAAGRLIAEEDSACALDHPFAYFQSARIRGKLQ